MWTFLVVLVLQSDDGSLVHQRAQMTFRNGDDCAYAQQFVPEGTMLGDWRVTYSACEPRTDV